MADNIQTANDCGVGPSALLGGGNGSEVAIAAARRLLQPRTIASDDFNDLIANCQQHNLDVVVVAEAYLRSELKIESMAEWCIEEREAANGGCGACSICCGELRHKLVHGGD